MERPLADLTYVVKELPLGPSFPTGQLHDISSGMRTFRPVIDTEKCRACKLGAITMIKEAEV